MCKAIDLTTNFFVRAVTKMEAPFAGQFSAIGPSSRPQKELFDEKPILLVSLQLNVLYRSQSIFGKTLFLKFICGAENKRVEHKVTENWAPYRLMT